MSEAWNSLYDAGGRWRRWELESFDEQVDTSATAAETVTGSEAAEPAAPALPDPAEVLAEIEQLREAARARGHAEGYAEGHAQGYEVGQREGHEQGLAEGREAGYAEGHAQGLELAREEAEKLRQLVHACAESIHNLETETGEALLSLALRVAEQVLRSTLDTQPERILDLIREVMHMDGGQQGTLRLRLNPADMERVDRFLEQEATVAHWRLQADPAIERGGCIVETALGSIDATLQTRWQRVVSTLGTRS